MSVSLKADIGGSVGSIQLNGADRLILNADGTLSATANPATGDRTSAVATMQKFADEFGASLTPNGYQKLPSGWIIQWGRYTNLDSTQTITFPLTFPVLAIGAIVAVDNGATDQIGSSSLTLSNMSISRGAADRSIRNGFWVVIGA